MAFSECLSQASLADCLQRFFATAPVDPAGMAQSLWLIIALPLAGAVVNGVFGKALGRSNTNLIACAAVAGSFLLSVLAFWTLNDPQAVLSSAYRRDPIPYAIGEDFGTWFAAGTFRAGFGLDVDHLSATMLLVVTGVSLLIHIYSTSYMGHDEGYWRYFAYLNLFVAMMLILVMADNLVLLFVGWEGVGLCSYLLIGFWYDDSAKAWAGRKAFVVNRIGDFGFLVGMMLLVLWVGALELQSRGTVAQPSADPWRVALLRSGPLNFRGLEEASRRIAPETSQITGAIPLDATIAQGPLAGFSFGSVLTAILLLFLLGAAGKSAQLPLYVWLPDAMAGPTPVSALIHAATMVTAGVYLFSRVSYLLVLSPTAMAAVALVGALTALWTALIAFAQNDIKKVLAYSTISQLGFMFMAVGLGIFWAAILHLVTHAFFKACLFLGAGSVMHGNAEETDIKKLGGLRKEMPWTWATFLIASIAISGFLIPLSGFFSKDAILHGVHSSALKGYAWVSPTVWEIGLVSAFCTAFYIGRLYLLTFEGKRAPDARVPHAHEADWVMRLPLVILAALSVLGIFYGIPLIHTSAGWETVMENFLSPVFVTARQLTRLFGTVKVEHEGSLLAAWAETWVIALAGGGLAGFLYLKYFPSPHRAPLPAERTVLHWARHKFYVDELYELLIVKPVRLASFVLYKVVDTLLIDTIAVRGTAWVTARLGSLLRYLQTGDTQSYAAVMVLALLGWAAYALFQVLR